MSRRDPWAEAVCRQQRYWDWARQHRASMWDWHVEGELPTAKSIRHQKARWQCFNCPLRQECLDLHDELAASTSMRVPGIWGGRIFADQSDIDQAAAA
ncbi:hypothetical protein ACWIGI_28730 [Nocardia sp. NPDC055321]